MVENDEQQSIGGIPDSDDAVVTGGEDAGAIRTIITGGDFIGVLESVDKMT